jgi:hypothetical protein
MGVRPGVGPLGEPALAVEKPKIGLSHAMSLLSARRFGQGTKKLRKSLAGCSVGCNTLACHGLRLRGKAARRARDAEIRW